MVKGPLRAYSGRVLRASTVLLYAVSLPTEHLKGKNSATQPFAICIQFVRSDVRHRIFTPQASISSALRPTRAVPFRLPSQQHIQRTVHAVPVPQHVEAQTDVKNGDCLVGAHRRFGFQRYKRGGGLDLD